MEKISNNSLSKNYDHIDIEKKWINCWNEQKCFISKPNNLKPYTIVIPPPNITGVLHLGHTLNATIQDILIRRARMNGYNACWVPGCDHASIATEAKVVEMLKNEKQINKNDLSREKFLEYVFEWKEKYGNIIYSQLERLGCSLDWSRKSFTMDKNYEKAVIKVFINLYEKKYIYRGSRMINWDVEAKTALSDEEVEHKEKIGQLIYLKYFIDENGKASDTEYLTVATQRPETIMGDVAICANPEDERYKRYKNKKVFIPLINKSIPIIFDEYVDKNFGTGILKITPAHDINDYNIGLKHNLEIIDILNQDGTINNNSTIYVGQERFKARKLIINELQEKGYVIKTEDYKTNIGFSQRTNTIVEPKISTQWFLKTDILNKKALNEVEQNNVKIHPKERFFNTYKHWMENPKDWCISRQLWWGQRIPVYYLPDGKYVVAENLNEAIKKAELLGYKNVELKQDEDCLDTWFSSWIWPIEVFKGISEPNNLEFNYYYPTTTLVTGQDIIFFWVARMIMAGLEFTNKKPFELVYFTGMVRDKQGRKMSKSLGNSPDLIKLIDEYGSDAVRFGVMISSPAGNDLLFDESSLQQGQRFNNKLWNAVKLIQILDSNKELKNINETENFANNWIINRIQQNKEIIENLYNQYKLSEVLKIIYNLIWDDFCSCYLEWIKPKNEEKISLQTFKTTILIFEELLQLLNPFLPFITEEIYNIINKHEVINILSTKQFENLKKYNIECINDGNRLKNILTSIRDIRKKIGLNQNEKILIEITQNNFEKIKSFEKILIKQANILKIKIVDQISINSILIMDENIQLHFINNYTKVINNNELLKEYEHLKNFKINIEMKLNNENFIKNAKAEILNLEKKKLNDTIEKINLIEQTLNK